MLRDITIGQYYPGNSVIHKLDSRFKIMAALSYVVSLFLIKNLITYVFISAFVFTTVKIAKVPVKFILKGLKPILFIIVFAFSINMFMTPGEVIFQVWKLKISDVGMYRAFFMAFRLIFLIIGTSILTLTTSPIVLTDGIEQLLNPFKRIGVPAHELAMMMTIALRFIPTLLEETDKIMKAQMARGADFETGNVLARAKSLVPLLVPLFVSAFRRADELAMAMEARCYRGGDNRTRLNVLQYNKRDMYGLAIMCLYFAVIIYIRVTL